MQGFSGENCNILGGHNIGYSEMYMALLLNTYRLLVGMPEGRRPLGRPRCRWLDNIRMDLIEMG
jgi:hypothetical protein